MSDSTSTAMMTARIPATDPTDLTTAALNREVGQLQAALAREIASLRQIIEARLEAADRALVLQAEGHNRRIQDLEQGQAGLMAEDAHHLPRTTFETTVAEWHIWRAAMDRLIAGTLVTRTDFDDQTKRQELLVTKAEQLLIERVAMALEGHRQLHMAHDTAHAAMHGQTDTALNRAEETMRGTAALHAVAHEREHLLTKEASGKADAAYAVRFDLLTTGQSRTENERATFVTRSEVLDKIEAVVARLDVLDKQSALTIDRLSLATANSAKIDSLEKEATLVRGRDTGIGLSWAVVLGAIAATATVVALVARVF